MDFDEIKKISIPSYLESIGCQVKEDKGYYGKYLAPYREDTKPSLKVDYNKNVWCDYGIGEGGSIIDLVMKIESCENWQAAEILQNRESAINSFSFHRSYISKEANSMIISEIKKIENNEALLNYLSERRIYLSIAKRYCLEIYYIHQDTGREFYGVAFKNDSDNYEVRWQKFKGCIGENNDEKKKDITFIKNGDNYKLCIFEGFVDFLSFLTLYPDREKCNNYIILNGLTMIGKAYPIISAHSKIYLFLDNDKSGINATNKLLSAFPKCKDCSYLYKPHKDVNEYLMLNYSVLKIKK